MPTVLLIDGFRFFFYMNEHLPVHIHVSKGGSSAKINLVPEVDLVYSDGFKAKEVKQIVNIVIEHRTLLIEKWYETFSK